MKVETPSMHEPNSVNRYGSTQMQMVASMSNQLTTINQSENAICRKDKSGKSLMVRKESSERRIIKLQSTGTRKQQEDGPEKEKELNVVDSVENLDL